MGAATPPATVRVIVTRPQDDAGPWVAGLTRPGWAVLALPLIAIAGPSRPEAQAALAACWSGLSPHPQYAVLMFVSGNAVTHFFAARPADATVDWHAPGAPRCWAPGPGTAEALRRAGVPDQAILAPDPQAGQFDSEALWQVAQPTVMPGQRALIVRGSDAEGRSAGRDWLAQQLQAAGVVVTLVAVYERRPPVFSAAQRALAQAAAHDGSVWLFSSSEAVANLVAAMAADPLAPDWSQARAVATHPRIAEAARAAGFGVVCMSRPNLSAVAASIESIA